MHKLINYNSFINESFNKYIYRFKTAKELIDYFNKTHYSYFNSLSEEIRSYFNFNTFGKMDYLLGKEVIPPKECLDENGNIIKNFYIDKEDVDEPFKGRLNVVKTLSDWEISEKMLIKETKPKTFYDKRKLEY